MKNLLVLILAFYCCQTIQAQNPFAQFGDKRKVLTMSNGRFNEFHDQDSIVQIGSIMLDVHKEIIVAYAPTDTTNYMPSPTVISRWLSPDLLSEKYYQLSPYNFVANNPILFVDPDGREIWINYGDNQRVKYESGKLYNEDGSKFKGKNSFVSTAFKSLNAISSTKNGKSVLGELSSSKNAFNFTNTYATDSKGTVQKDALSFEANKNGGGEIHAGALLADTDPGQKTENVAHELYHGYQHENGQGGATVNNEVEAYLFGRSVAIQSGQAFDYSFGNLSNMGKVYDNAMFNSITNPQFDPASFNSAVMTFKTGSRVNQGGIYNKFKYSLKKPLISKFYPLTE